MRALPVFNLLILIKMATWIFLLVSACFRFSYGLPVNGYLLENDGHGNFTNVTEKVAPGLKNQE